MARLVYGHTGGDVIAQISVTDGDYEPSTATFDAFTTRTGATQHTALLNMAGGAITVVTPDANGWIRFQGQDTYTGSYWLQDQANPSDPRWRIDPGGTPERVEALEIAGAGIGVTDGDKVDIVVTDTGATWNIKAEAVGTTEIADGTVTLPKLPDVATASWLGRVTAGTGDVEVLTKAQMLAGLNVADGATSDANAVTLIGDQTIGDVKTFTVAPIVPANSWTISDTGGLTGTLFTKQSTVEWNAGTNTWAARPTAGDAPHVVFWSTHDIDATPPDDVNLALGDTWKRHPDAPPA